MINVLLVEDNLVFRKGIEAFLCRHGMRVTSAEHGQEALALLRVAENTPDIILLDYAMPVMDGGVFLQHLREQRQWSAIPVLLITAVSELEDEQKRRNLSIQAMLLKSRFSLRQLLEQITVLLPRHQRNAVA